MKSLFKVCNKRRHVLINRKFSSGLDEDEIEELELVRAYCVWYVDKHHPLPFDHLATFEEKIRSRIEDDNTNTTSD